MVEGEERREDLKKCLFLLIEHCIVRLFLLKTNKSFYGLISRALFRQKKSRRCTNTNKKIMILSAQLVCSELPSDPVPGEGHDRPESFDFGITAQFRFEKIEIRSLETEEPSLHERLPRGQKEEEEEDIDDGETTISSNHEMQRKRERKKG